MMAVTEYLVLSADFAFTREFMKRTMKQIEYVVDNGGHIFYDLNHQNGNPFTDVARFLEVKGTGTKCVPLYCAAADNGSGCDYRDEPDQYINSYNGAKDVKSYLC
jgi:hypothetical protein